jgi:hypothetical protein
MLVVGSRSVNPIVDGPVRAPLLARLSPSLRDGLALVLSNGLTSAVGLGYWVLAARLRRSVSTTWRSPR